MIYSTKERALQAADELNVQNGYAMAYAVIDEKGNFTVVRAHCIDNWLRAHSARSLIS
jgi:hypothetical protein